MVIGNRWWRWLWGFKHVATVSPCCVMSRRHNSSPQPVWIPSFFPPGLEDRGHVRAWFKQIVANDGQVDDTVADPLVASGEVLLPFSRTVIADLKPTLIISTLFSMGLAIPLAEEFDIPWCFVNPSFYFGENSITTYEEDWHGPYIPILARDSFHRLAQQADIVLHATDSHYDFLPAPIPEKHHFVGFLLWEPTSDPPAILSEPGDPWVLLSASTEPQPEEVLMVRAALDALAERPVRVLLTLPDETARKELGPVPLNTTVMGFAPHTPIIKQSALVINHAGHGIVSKCLTYGVPMVLLPWDRDQPGVAIRAAKMGSSTLVHRSQITAEAVQDAVGCHLR